MLGYDLVGMFRPRVRIVSVQHYHVRHLKYYLNKANMMIRGSFDVVTPTEALGWAFTPGQTEPVLVQAVLNQEILGEAFADRHRPDLSAAGFGNGKAGFSIKFFRPIDPIYLPFIAIKINGGDAELPRAPVMGFKDFFTSLHLAKPHAGRHRSLTGGLWTDRTDAAALLQGKLRIGAISPEVAPTIEKLVHYGVTVAEIEHAPLSGWQQEQQSTATNALLNTPAVRDLLSLVFEDVPVVAATHWFTASELDFSQPSIRNPSPSPGECLELVIAFDEGVSLDVVRNSHAMPEFTVSGKSRWITTSAGDPTSSAPVGPLDNEPLAFCKLALVGPGCIYRLRCTAGATAIRLTLVPMRGRTLDMIVAES